jgi:DNA-binding CsgD family transcriptional regulator
MNLSLADLNVLGRILSLLAVQIPPDELRHRLGHHLLSLLRADHFASYVWDEQRQLYGRGVWLNMDPANLTRYESTYQFSSPITSLLQARRGATLVSEVLPHERLLRTEYFNDFLARDGLHWGMTLHAFDGPRALGDLRIWRGRHRGEFTLREKLLLSLIEPALIRALSRGHDAAAPAAQPTHALALAQHERLSERERTVARLVCNGLTDKQIAQQLAISPATVRTYLQRLFEKLGVNRRSALAQLGPALR